MHGIRPSVGDDVSAYSCEDFTGHGRGDGLEGWGMII